VLACVAEEGTYDFRAIFDSFRDWELLNNKAIQNNR
jgi:hypothetical protein